MIKLHLSRLLMLVALAGFVSKGFAMEGEAPAAEPAPAAVAEPAAAPAAAPAVVEVEPKNTDEALAFLAKDIQGVNAAVEAVPADNPIKKALNEIKNAFDSIRDALAFLVSRIELLEDGTGVKTPPAKVKKRVSAKIKKIGKGKKKPRKGKEAAARKLPRGRKTPKKKD